jgi:hypothetical protein
VNENLPNQTGRLCGGLVTDRADVSRCTRSRGEGIVRVALGAKTIQRIYTIRIRNSDLHLNGIYSLDISGVKVKLRLLSRSSGEGGHEVAKVYWNGAFSCAQLAYKPG